MVEGFSWLKKMAGIATVGIGLHGAPDAAHGEPLPPQPPEKNRLTEIIDGQDSERPANLLPKDIIHARPVDEDDSDARDDGGSEGLDARFNPISSDHQKKAE